jgi:hypothetical protein
VIEKNLEPPLTVSMHPVQQLELNQHNQKTMNLAEILKDSNYKLSQFTSQEIDGLEQALILKQVKSVKCLSLVNQG